MMYLADPGNSSYRLYRKTGVNAKGFDLKEKLNKEPIFEAKAALGDHRAIERNLF